MTIVEDNETQEETQLRQMWNALMGQIGEVDGVLDSFSDAAAAGKRKLSNELVEKYQVSWEPVANKLSEQMDTFDEEKVVGAYLGLIRALATKYDTPVGEFLTKLVEDQPKSETPDMTEDQKKELSASRTKIFTQLKQIRDLAINFDEAVPVLDENGNITSVPGWELPKVRRGGFGKRGKRALGYYTWSIDGQDVEEDADNTKGVAAILGYEKVSEFTKALKTAGVETSKHEADFQVELKGKVVTGTLVADSSDDDSGDDDDDDDEGDSGEEFVSSEE